MSLQSSDFILDEGLDDDPDILSAHLQHPLPSPPPPVPSTAPAPPSCVPLPSSCTVIIDNLPPNFSRSDLNDFLSPPSPIVSLQLNRLDSPARLRLKVTFSTREAAAAALSHDGESVEGKVVTVREEEGWWEKAVKVGETWGEKVKEVDKGWGVSEKMGEVRERVITMDKEWGVSEKVGEMVGKGKDVADEVDRELGLTRGVSKVMGDVGGVVGKVVGEVEETWMVGDKVREVANWGMKDERVGGVVRGVVGAVGGKDPASRKNYKPRGVEQTEELESDVGSTR